ncbi:extensin family protein [Pleomorphomonas sp. PLEO]|uniref:extensin-like domain-containing protein n=1 Tax=Pleomorphomonas sp. PLEO TaxID=3239306 RepID=UPI00351E2DC4
MRPYRIASGLISLILSATLAGCGFFESEEREPWRAQAEAACYARNLVKLSPLIQPAHAIEGKGICGIDRPLKVKALEDGTISLGSRSLVLSCPMTAALERWVAQSVMPAALARYGLQVVEIKNFGTYNCRSRNNISGARLSEHAFANAFDFAGIVLSNGYTVTVKAGWNGNATDRAFLREIAHGACGTFSTVLGPGADRQHDNHLHLDLARHNNAGTYRYCKPFPQVPPLGAPMFTPDQNVPMASNLPANPVWPAAQPAPAAPTYANGNPSFDAPLPPAPIGNGNQPAYQTAQPTYQAPQQAYPAAQPTYTDAPAAQPPGCPAGYICTPVGQGNYVPPPTGSGNIGWSVGAQPAQSYSPTDITGSVPGPYSDD